MKHWAKMRLKWKLKSNFFKLAAFIWKTADKLLQIS